tara:strand:- start:197 stop:775 length:579 start_codon:yes stop_codon:yes gene_type:complete
MGFILILNKFKFILKQNKGTMVLLVVLILASLLKGEINQIVALIDNRLNIIIYCILFSILGCLGLPTLPLTLLGTKLYGPLNTSLFTSISILVSIAMQIKYKDTLGFRISKDNYIKKLGNNIMTSKRNKASLILFATRVNPIMPLQIYSAISSFYLKRNGNYKKNILTIFTIAYIGSLLASLLITYLYAYIG